MDICTYHIARRASAYKWFFLVFFYNHYPYKKKKIVPCCQNCLKYKKRQHRQLVTTLFSQIQLIFMKEIIHIIQICFSIKRRKLSSVVPVVFNGIFVCSPQAGNYHEFSLKYSVWLLWNHCLHALKFPNLLFQKEKSANFRGKIEQITASFRAYHTAIRYLLHRQKLLLGAQKTHAERLICCNCLTYNHLPKPLFPCDISALRRIRNSTGDSQAHKTAKFSNFEGMK